MTDIERRTIKNALLKCAEEQKNRPVYTGEVIPSLICRAATERIGELENENIELKQKYDNLLSDVHHILVSPHKSDKECLDEITMYFRGLGV